MGRVQILIKTNRKMESYKTTQEQLQMNTRHYRYTYFEIRMNHNVVALQISTNQITIHNNVQIEGNVHATPPQLYNLQHIQSFPLTTKSIDKQRVQQRQPQCKGLPSGQTLHLPPILHEWRYNNDSTDKGKHVTKNTQQHNRTRTNH